MQLNRNPLAKILEDIPVLVLSQTNCTCIRLSINYHYQLNRYDSNLVLNQDDDGTWELLLTLPSTISIV